MNMKELLTSLLNAFGFAFWVEILTETPNCTYYFGPFMTQQEAQTSQFGYLEDLEAEGAQGIKVRIKRCKPNTLTIAEDLGNRVEPWILPALSGQP
ncbi:hypothetical protein PCC9214_03669 [Planktothrix tepida]|uniref:DUF1816 domain-containing protein n=3 Tax=Microcoleaceae TaxID=1892252 RepID=A0A1J1LRJ6_9CYAN|nr:hypothetical protein NO713_01989 [Planktothrix pseudagardhii]CAD5968755.1 hypothetical protein PCC9214_03669 [Planktothrix tepida]CUR35216.1 conserved hypothetical protein [Planktothrix tepida PCC 9214]